MPPSISRNLGPGSQGDDVKQLQDWLKSQGYFPANQSTTTNYGPITQKAVSAWQKSKGIDSTGSFDAITRKFVEQSNQLSIPGQTIKTGGVTTPATINKPAQSMDFPRPDNITSPGNTVSDGQVSDSGPINKPTTTNTNSTTGAGNSVSNTTDTKKTATGIPYNPVWSPYGVTEDVWKTLNSTQQAQVAIGMDMNLANYASSANSLSMEDATKQALNDPAIVGKYSDALGLDKQEFTQSLNDLQTSTSTEFRQYKDKFANDQKALAEAHAAAGSAYSGFRGKAQEQLKQNESDVIESSRAALKKSVQKMTSDFESKYGTGSTPKTDISFVNPLNNAPETVSGEKAGNIIGSSTLAKSSDVNTAAGQNIQMVEPIKITPLQIS